MKKLIPILLIFFILISLQTFIHFNEKNKNSLNSIKNCNELNYDEHQLNRAENFSDFEIDLIIDDERKWKKIILNTHLSEYEDKSFTYDATYTNVKLIVKNKFNFKCLLKAKIKPHGDLLDHYRDYGPGYDPIYVLPSLKVKLVEGNIFGIVEFRLLVPKTRNEGNEIFATSLFEELGFYAPRTSYVRLNYNNKKYKFLFQEKLNKEFLENNSLQEGLFFAGDERFSFKYENISSQNGKVIQEKETGISKFRITETKFLRRNEIFIKPAINALEALNASSHFYSSSIKQSWLIDYFTSQKNYRYEKFFINLPKFDALMYAIGADHGLSRDDRRFYLDILNETLIPIYYDGAVKIFSGDVFTSLNFNSDISQQLKQKKKFTNSAKIGAPLLIKRIEQLDIEKLKKKIENRGLNVPLNDLNSIKTLIKNNLLILSNLSVNQIVDISTSIQHPIKNKKAINKNINASYLFILDDGFKQCDLLLISCEVKKLSKKETLLALNQKLQDKNANELILLGKQSKFEKLEDNYIEDKKIYSLDNFNFKIFGEIDFDINKELKQIKFFKKKKNSRVLFFDSMIEDWKIEFVDLTQDTEDIINRDINNLSGCINIYDSEVRNLKIFSKDTKCEDGINFVRSKGTIQELTIKNSLFDGFDADFSDLIIDKANVDNSNNDCLDFSYGIYILSNIKLNLCGDKAISVGESSKLELNNFIISNSVVGVSSKDNAVVNVDYGKIYDVKKCFSLYKKKQEFNGGLLSYKNLKCENYDDFAFKDNYSKLIVSN
jgi:hypothetical protein